MRKVSEVIQLAADDPRYLVDVKYLCVVLSHLATEGKVTTGELVEASQVITEALRPFSQLRSHLRNSGAITHLMDERDPEYSQVAPAYWKKLTADLRAEGR